MEDRNEKTGGKANSRPLGTAYIVLLCVAFGLLAAALAFLAFSNYNKKKEVCDAEKAFIDSLHVFPPVDFTDSLYAKVVVNKYEDDAPRVVAYYVMDSLGNPTSELAHETHYYENQHVYIDGNVHADKRDGLWYAYFPDGTVQTKAFYVDGKEEGRYTVYYSNGNVRYTGEYKQGRQTGEWRFYNEDGTLSHTKSY